ncbi:MAG TPA: hypothetical protein PKE47_05730 [Verrucomicrobiota bacterium]|nr:hypothetical protein [Verrucomicrobiota bacterium]
MRTQILLASAALVGLGALSASAQVYSVNAVGYVNIEVPARGFALIANQLNASPNNQVANVLPAVPEDTALYLWTGTAFSVNIFERGAWATPTAVLGPGAAAFVLNPLNALLTLTMVGEVPQGSLATPLTVGFNLVSSQVPQAGGLQSVLGYPAAEDDVVYKWNKASQSYSVVTFEGGEWQGTEPALTVGEGVFVRRTSAGSWNRTFSVNQ